MKTIAKMKGRLGAIFTRVNDAAIKALVAFQTQDPAEAKKDRFFYRVSALIGILGGSSGIAHADTDMFSKAGKLLSEYYGKFFALTTGIAALCAIIAVIIAMISPKEKSASAGWAWLKRIIGCWLVINVLGGLFAIGENLTEGQHFGTN